MLPGIYDSFQHWGEKYQTIWIYSDPHFSDEDLKCGIKNRPSDEEQIKNINSCAGRKDVLIILGDVGNIECVRRLRAARKILIMGNHDTGSTKYKREVIQRVFDHNLYANKDEVYAAMRKQYPNWKIDIYEDCDDLYSSSGCWVVYADNCLFDEVYEGALIVGEKLILSHEPITGLTWAINLHGHVHDKRAKTDVYHINCCSDVIGYEPINLTQKLKSGLMSAITTIHRATIDSATERKAKRRGKKIGK